MRFIKKKNLKISDKFSFKHKLLIIIILCISFPILFSMGSVIYTSSNIMKSQTIENENYSLEIGNLYINKTISDIIQIMNYILFDDEIKSILNKSLHEPIKPSSFLEVNSKLDHLTRNSNINLYIIPTQGEQYFVNKNYRDKVDLDVARERFAILEKMHTFKVHSFTSLELELEGKDINQDEQMFLLGRRLINYNNQTTAYIFAGINKNEIDKLLSSSEKNENRNIFLLDETGRVLYDEKMDIIGDEFTRFSELNKNNSVFIYEDGNDYLMSHRDIGFANKSLVSLTLYNEATAALGKAYTINIYLLGAAFVLLIVTLFIVVSKFTQPIGKLAGIAKEIEEGNLDVRSNIDRKDEIGRLGVAFDLMLDKIQDMIYQVKVEQSIKRKKEIEILQAKIKPHFIFNILNTIRIRMIKNGDTETSSLIVSFSKFLRNTYRGEEWITLHEEVNYTLDYLNLINFMRKQNIEVHLNLSSSTLGVMVPRFFIQPIVENSCKHGFLNQLGNIEINTREEENYVIVIVQDDGLGIDESRLKLLQDHLNLNKQNIVSKYLRDDEKMFGIGLKNIYERMRLIYGDQLSMKIESKSNRGTVVTFRLPIKGGGLINESITS
ncbi:cache domain-containing sensor histidine kinase [Alkalihalobacillus sp. 1P02AB]|uniref:cache domain-containing sensor histidine kinase n=1 Tax=Alkalihalobacillus sp. 1P02AB TaxID=3132260 RepID=UPI0039A58C7B